MYKIKLYMEDGHHVNTHDYFFTAPNATIAVEKLIEFLKMAQENYDGEHESYYPTTAMLYHLELSDKPSSNFTYVTEMD